jgi:hypothetical protein
MQAHRPLTGRGDSKPPMETGACQGYCEIADVLRHI